MSQIKLTMEDLRVEFSHAGKVTAAVRDVSFALGREKLAIVGESGSGKSTVGRSLLRLHPATAKVTAKTCVLAISTCSTAAKNRCRAFAAGACR